MKQYVIAIDGGGSKTDILLVDTEDEIAGRMTAPPSNPNDRGIESVCELLCRHCLGLCEKSGVQPHQVRAVFAGIAGASSGDYSSQIAGSLKKVFCDAIVEASHDGINVLYGCFGAEGDGVSIICGTGSSCFVKKGKQIFRIGGYGTYDRCGSGYEMGLAAISHALRVCDGRDKAGLLSRSVCKKLGGDPVELIDKLTGYGKKEVASYAECVFCAWEQGDKKAEEIVEENLSYIAELITRAGDFFEEEYTVALAGGIFKNPKADLYLAQKLSSRVWLTKSGSDPVWGAATYAKQLLT